ncbi:uncharacterized protein [Heterodontus francisci]|uniref:uncharacterized protein isoform X7 n=1 Tax=Heterodontus francisci TaxID=7792 RepID=UPI00355B4C0E
MIMKLQSLLLLLCGLVADQLSAKPVIVTKEPTKMKKYQAYEPPKVITKIIKTHKPDKVPKYQTYQPYVPKYQTYQPMEPKYQTYQPIEPKYQTYEPYEPKYQTYEPYDSHNDFYNDGGDYIDNDGSGMSHMK